VLDPLDPNTDLKSLSIHGAAPQEKVILFFEKIGKRYYPQNKIIQTEKFDN
jgi:hypothetical protein